MKKNRVLIVGGGFGGVKTALELADDSRFDITLLSEGENFRYYPTLYHTATGGVQAQSVIPLARLFEGKPIKLVKGTAARLDRQKKLITTTDDQKHAYDTLVLSLGSLPNYFGIEGIEQYSYNIITPESARRFKDHLHRQLSDERKPDLHYVVVGGGATGIELAGALTGYLKVIMKAHDIERKAVHIDLVEAAPQLVPRMPSRMSKRIAKRLRSLGVKLYLNRKVQGQTADALTVDGKPIQSHTVVWSAGITISPFYKANQFTMGEHGKVAVDDYLQAEPDIYVIGDNAATEYSGTAQTALYDAKFVAHNLQQKAESKLMKRYRPKRPIYVLPVGPNWAAVWWGRWQIYGFLGWMLRLAADAVAFKDYEPWWRAGAQWLTEFQTEEDCDLCVQPYHRSGQP